MTLMRKNKVVLGLSGGVDSTAAALLLLEKGFDVTGLYFSVKEDEESLKKAETAANQLGIELICRDVGCCFEKEVIGNFCSEYQKGRTPNPCIICNPRVKFKTLLDTANEVGAYYIATGHYADTFYDEETGLWYIKQASNLRKDQSYMLYRLSQEMISRLMLPLNNIDSKEQIRQMARDRLMDNAEARDSQEICFIDSNETYRDFLRARGIVSSEGDFTDSKGNVLGRHKGILNYTIGQRKGLGIALGRPAFVTAIDAENNRVILGDNEELFTTEVISEGNIIMGRKPDAICGQGEAASFGIIGMNDGLKAKIRYGARAAEAEIELMPDGRVKTVFSSPQRAATPGQSIVFYKDDLVVGGGFIL